MRRFLCPGLVLAAVLASSAYAAPATPGDGTLSVRSGTGVVQVVGRGSLIGQLDRGRLVVDDLAPGVGEAPIVSGYDKVRWLGESRWLFSGNDLRFRVIGGSFRVRVSGVGINLSVVARGSATVAGAGTLDDGELSTDGGDSYRALPLVSTAIPLGATAAPPAPAP